MITFKQQFTFTEESVKNFAIFLGWQEKLTRQVEKEDTAVEPPAIYTETEEYDNPETFTDYVDRLAKEHSAKFTNAYAVSLKEQEINRQVEELKATIEPAIDEQIIKPVEDALTSEVVID